MTSYNIESIFTKKNQFCCCCVCRCLVWFRSLSHAPQQQLPEQRRKRKKNTRREYVKNTAGSRREKENQFKWPAGPLGFAFNSNKKFFLMINNARRTYFIIHSHMLYSTYVPYACCLLPAICIRHECIGLICQMFFNLNRIN